MASATKKQKLETNGISQPDSADDQDILQKVDNVQLEIDQLNEKASDEILAVERRYVKLRQPLYERRAELVKKIPGFWTTVLIGHGRLSELISEIDEEALHSLERIEVHEFDDIKSGYKIDFHFSENPFFTNKCLTKEYHLIESGELSSKSTVVSWKPGKRLVPPSSTTTAQPASRRIHEAESFFRWFVDGSGADYGGDEIGELIKDDIWPNPLQYYLAEDANGTYGTEGDDYDDSIDRTAELENELNGDDDDDEDDDEDEDDEDEDDDDDDDGDVDESEEV